MASLQSIPRFLLPRGPLLLRPQYRFLAVPQVSNIPLRHASATAKGLSEEFRRRQEALLKQKQKATTPTPVIPQPDKYRPPSHSARKPNRNLENKIYGPPLTEEDRKRMATKKYPNMMSPEGTFSHWFLHNKAIHLWITMVRRLLPQSFHNMLLYPQTSRPHIDNLPGHPNLPSSNRMVPRLHLQNDLRRSAPYTQGVCPPPYPEHEPLHRGLQDAHAADEPAIPATAPEEG